MKILAFILVTIFSCFASANSFVCGNSQTSVLNSEKSNFPYFVVSTFNKEYSVNHKFHAYYIFFNMQCVNDSKGKSYLLIKTNAGGSGSLDNYSLIDTTNGKLVITSKSQPVTPEERRKGLKTSNLKEVEKILGSKPKRFSCNIREQTKTEICMVSDVVLG